MFYTYLRDTGSFFHKQTRHNMPIDPSALPDRAPDRKGTYLGRPWRIYQISPTKAFGVVVDNSGDFLRVPDRPGAYIGGDLLDVQDLEEQIRARIDRLDRVRNVRLHDPYL